MNKTLPLLVFAFLAAAQPSRADDQRISVDVKAPFEPASAVGLIINETTTVQKVDAVISRSKDNGIVVSFPFRDSEIKDGAAATAMVIAEDGTMAFGEMKLIDSPESRRSLSEIPECPAEKIVTSGLEGQLGLLQSLLDVRTARRTNAQRQLQEFLTPEMIAKLSRLEKGFGLVNPTPLSARMSPLELNDRIIRITAALKDFRAAKQRAEEKAAAGAAAESGEPADGPPAEETPTEAAAEDVPADIPADAAAGN